MTQILILSAGLLTALLVAITICFKNKLLIFVTAAVAFAFANMLYFAYEGVKGWPTDDTIEVKGVLASVVILNPSTGDPGAIYISLFPTNPGEWYEYKYHRYAPRTFFIKYSNDRAAKFEEAKQAMMEGKEVKINGIPPETSTGGQDGEGEENNGILSVIGDALGKLLPKQKDTYKPEVPPDVEIINPSIPEQKETSQ